MGRCFVVAEALGSCLPRAIVEPVTIASEVAAAAAGLLHVATVAEATTAALRQWLLLPAAERVQMVKRALQLFQERFDFASVARTLLPVLEATRPASMILANNTPFEGASFSRRNRLARFAWQLVYTLLFRPTPPPLHAWRCFLLRCFGARIAAGCHIYSDARIWAPWNLHMAAQACLGPRVICYSMAPIHLGERVVVSQGAHLCTGSHDYTSATFPLFARPITIGADAWICTEAFVGPGVQIGEGAVIGARAVAMRSQPAWMVCAGNPCQPLKPRIHPSNCLTCAMPS